MKTKTETFIRDLGDGLILRRASVEDADALATMNSIMHSDDGPEKPNERIGAWTRDLIAKPHPTLAVNDFTIVEESATGRIVSTLCLIPQTWTYEGVEFGVGRPELVSTLPEFRKRGLVRIQMDEVHKWGEERGHLVQIITGIPYFYRQFGYDMALNLAGRRYGFEPHVPALKSGETEKYVLRPACEADIDFILSVYEANEKLYAISCKRTPENIRYEMSGQSPDNINHFDMVMIEDAGGKPLGFFQHATELWFGGLYCVYFGLEKGVSWLDVSPAVARYLWKKGGEYAERDTQTRSAFGFSLGEWHPVYEAMDDKLPSARKPYAYYIRVPDLPAFLNHVKLALEKRLADSVAAGHTGELKLSFYREGLKLVFERGRITSVEPMKVASGTETDASFPDLTFLHLVFGHRSLDELRHAFTDCYFENNTARVLLNALFPKRLSDVYSVY
ncbi:MAG TPA: GNAT family N-acetyltransferase [Anaerolineales bacterium]|nr:GNAT family N-acetyltransferase [Anaerolineales bacterium]